MRGGCYPPLDKISIFSYLYIDTIPGSKEDTMPEIRRSSDLRNNYNEVSRLCHRYREPVFITKNGVGDLAVMSIESYNAGLARLELYDALAEGKRDFETGDIIHEDEMRQFLQELKTRVYS
jgi:prevent-host-death family protein